MNTYLPALALTAAAAFAPAAASALTVKLDTDFGIVDLTTGNVDLGRGTLVADFDDNATSGGTVIPNGLLFDGGTLFFDGATLTSAFSTTIPFAETSVNFMTGQFNFLKFDGSSLFSAVDADIPFSNRSNLSDLVGSIIDDLTTTIDVPTRNGAITLFGGPEERVVTTGSIDHWELTDGTLNPTTPVPVGGALGNMLLGAAALGGFAAWRRRYALG